jgi:hypothetical protein
VIHSVCVAETRALITLDLDFSNPIRFPVARTPGILVLRPPRATLPLIGRLLRALPVLLETYSPAGTLWIVELGRLRVFKPDETEQI